MFQFKRENGRKMLFMGGKYSPFVCKYYPLIKYIKPYKIPFIRRNTPNSHFSAFTLIELMVALAVVAILSLIAVPNMRAIIQNNRVMTLSNDFLSDINLARSEAIKRVVNVRICTWDSTSTPSAPACNGGGNWSLGRAVWADMNSDGVLNAGELVRSREGLAPMTLTPNAAVDPIIFNSRGVPASNVTFRLCDDRGTAFAKNITVNATGQASVPTSPPLSTVTVCP